MRAFLARDGTDWDWAGALMVTDAFDNLHYLRRFAEAYAKGLKRTGRRRR
jgi:hypothetical protein